MIRREIHTFSDSRKEATAAAVYLRELNSDGVVSVSLLFGW